MWVAFDKRAVHKRPGVALIGIAYQVFRLPGRITTELPLAPSRKSGATAPPQPCRLDFFEGLIRLYLKRLQKPAITVAGQIVIRIFRVYQSAVTQDIANLPTHHRMCVEIIDAVQLPRRHFS